jgi:hypothetical protein
MRCDTPPPHPNPLDTKMPPHPICGRCATPLHAACQDQAHAHHIIQDSASTGHTQREREHHSKTARGLNVAFCRNSVIVIHRYLSTHTAAANFSLPSSYSRSIMPCLPACLHQEPQTESRRGGPKKNTYTHEKKARCESSHTPEEELFTSVFREKKAGVRSSPYARHPSVFELTEIERYDRDKTCFSPHLHCAGHRARHGEGGKRAEF